MEHIPGVTLSDKLARGPLREKEIAHLGVQLAKGLAAAHEQGVVHRNLKPGNLRVTVRGGGRFGPRGTVLLPRGTPTGLLILARTRLGMASTCVLLIGGNRGDGFAS